MKVGIVHFMAFPDISPGLELINSIKRVAEDEFFGSIEITTIPNDARADIAELLETSKLVVGYHAGPTCCFEPLPQGMIGVRD